MNGKGSAPRTQRPPHEVYASNWDRTFASLRSDTPLELEPETKPDMISWPAAAGATFLVLWTTALILTILQAAAQ